MTSIPNQHVLLSDYVGRSIDLSEHHRKRERLGNSTIEHVLVARHQATVVRETQITQSRGQLTVLELDTGRSIALASRLDEKVPASVWGSVKLEDGTGRWTGNRDVSAFEAEWANHNPSLARTAIAKSWKSALQYHLEERDASGIVITPGLRVAQAGAIHSILGHWSSSSEPATVVMPTGTGKTETMVAVTVAAQPECVLVVVPSRYLVQQTINKFLTFGFLRNSGNVVASARFPIVGHLHRRPTKSKDLAVFDRCNVVIATIGVIAQGGAERFLDDVAARCSHIFIDEAHHVPAKTWSGLRTAFQARHRHILQFTATPFREDGKLIDGRIVFSYPLAKALDAGYFAHVGLEAVDEPDPRKSDEAIARKAIEVLEKDITAGHDHLLLARCKSIERADVIGALYSRYAPHLSPVVIHDHKDQKLDLLDKIMRRESRIVVCVEMLKEGFDLPNLKVAAIHDKQKSFGVLLQFVGRFIRTGSPSLGDATVVANIASDDIADSLESLYSEDSDWPKLLSEFSFSKIESKRRLLHFLQSANELTQDLAPEDRAAHLTLRAITPKFSAVTYQATQFDEHAFHEGLPSGFTVQRAWYEPSSKTLIVAGFLRDSPKWSKSRGLIDETWHVFIARFIPDRKLLFVYSSIKGDMPTTFAQAVTGNSCVLVKGETPFKVLGHINRLAYQQVGLTRRGRRSLHYSRHAGSDIGPTLDRIVDAGSSKNDVFASGFEDGQKVGVGASKKGKLWSYSNGTVQEYIEWTDRTAAKLTDPSIDVNALLQTMARATPVEEIPDLAPLSLEWPYNIQMKHAHTYELSVGDSQYSLLEAEISLPQIAPDRRSYEFDFRIADSVVRFRLALVKEAGFKIARVSGPSVELRIGQTRKPIEEFFDDNPPILLFVDLSELEGCDYYKFVYEAIQLKPSQLVSRDFTGIDFRVESRRHVSGPRIDSIQQRALEWCQSEGFDVIYDDDGSNEIADLVCLKESDDEILIRLVHCKYSSEDGTGARLKDIEVLASQMTRSSKWVPSLENIERQIKRRDLARKTAGDSDRYLEGDAKALIAIVRAARYKRVTKEVIAVQPGLSKKAITERISTVLAAASRFLEDTVEANVAIWCSE